MDVLKSVQGITTGNTHSSLFWYNTICNGYEFDLKCLWTGYVFDIVYIKWIDDTERIGSKNRQKQSEAYFGTKVYVMDMTWICCEN